MNMSASHVLFRVAIASALAVMASACRKGEVDAYGNFEAEEVVVSAETAGQLVQFRVEEGVKLPAGAVVGTIDTAQLALQRRELLARRDAGRSRTTEVRQQVKVLESQQSVSRREYERTQRLFEQQAATAQQLDRAERDYRTLNEQIEATRAAAGTTRGDVASIDAQVAIIEDRLRRTQIANPMEGTVLTKYAERGELLQVGQPLYKIASLDTLTLRAFVSGAQLAAVRLGASVLVRIDGGSTEDKDSMRELPGRVSWVSAQAEFTPTPIQTREERTEQVYAVKVRVPNPGGVLKVGMPAELVIAR
ncbi:MAG: HlyD family efflux transporter periplasmic adaptor subunit [Gemmatimonadaceae bacterium]|nr:HlyD family efflux transporter periplasmic adaptor subunit [Gemmatimonadaceae bacterium]